MFRPLTGIPTLALVVALVVPRAAIAGSQMISITSAAVDTTYTPVGYTTPVTVTGHGASGTQSVPGWSWNYTGNFTDGRYPTYMSYANNRYMCIGPSAGIGTSYDCDSTDNLPPAGADYNGYEFMYFSFTLPPTYTNARLNFGRLLADDRMVVSLNGQVLGGYSIDPACAGQPQLGPSGTTNFDFIKLSGNVWFDSPGLSHAGENELRLWVNNTGGGGCGSAMTERPSGVDLYGFVTYDLITPAPAPALSVGFLVLTAGLLTGVGALLVHRRSLSAE